MSSPMSLRPQGARPFASLFVQIAVYAIGLVGAAATGIVAQRNGLGVSAFVVFLVAFFVYTRIIAAVVTLVRRFYVRVTKLRMKKLGAPAVSKNVNPFVGLRERALRISAASLGLGTSAQTQPFGVIMETGFSEGVATLVCFATGDASLYFSTGGGIIGGGGHEAVRQAAKRFVEESDPYSALMAPAAEYPLAKPGRTVFYVLTAAGTRSADFLEDDLGDGRTEFSPLFFAGQDVITTLRESTKPASE
jgi:hypothetical protein